MSTLIVLYNYNKYYNRIVKKLDTFAEYEALITPVGNNPAPLKGFKLTEKNFNYQDGVFASHIVNIPRDYASFYKLEQPDYLIQAENYVENNVTYTKITRWYVLEATKQRGCQFELSLKRDLLADFYSEIIEAPVFIERGQSQNISDPAIFNKEGFTFNQIKRGELLLNDNKYSGNKGGWIVGYLARNATAEESEITATGKEEAPASATYIYENLPEKVRKCIEAGTGNFFITDRMLLTIRSYIHDTVNGSYSVGIGAYVKNNGEGDYENEFSYGYPFDLLKTNYAKFEGSWTIQQIYEYIDLFLRGTTRLSIINAFETWFNSQLDDNDFTTPGLLEPYNGIIYQKDGQYYRLQINKLGGEISDIVRNTENDPQLDSTNPAKQKVYTTSQIKSRVDAIAIQIRGLMNSIIAGSSRVLDAEEDQSKTSIYIRNRGVAYRLTSTLVTELEVTATLHKERNKLYDAPYDMFCIPYGNVEVRKDNNVVCVSAANVALPIARGIALSGTTLQVYDIQVLPYCPCPEFIDSQGRIDLSGLTLKKDYDLIIEDGNRTASVILYAKTCKGTFDIEVPVTSDNYDYCVSENESITEKKVRSETRVIRFSSPNFASFFDINVEKNAGIIQLNVDYFYKPYTPYIHVAPYFKNMYGNDYNDPKGLICSGDFSIATASSQWEAYQIQNKNYENIFNRQIQNLDINNSISYDQQKLASGISVASTALTGAVGGALAGFMLAGPAGAVAGAAAGGAASAGLSSYGRQKDLEYLSKSQKEARSYMEDMYTYQLGNIQALPNTLTKVSAFTANNKIFPFIEFYDCTNEEKEALRNKLKYNGMTIMRIGKIADFRYGPEHYVQGKLIRLEGISEDSHVIAEIANEIKEGAYFYGYDSIGS